MPSKKQYNLVQNDDYDTRIPLHPEEAFHHGITFQAKYIGTLDVPRPTSRVEIVAAMRRIRYEFKAKGIKKKKVTVDISVDGVRVSLRKKKKKKKQWLDENSMLLMHHPIYRIFYVSHDSQDLKIFSYIARDSSSDLFKCNVFKSNKKSQAMRIVRTVGQAFEVCHKLSAGAPGGPGGHDVDVDDEEEALHGGGARGELLEGGGGGGDGDEGLPRRVPSDTALSDATTLSPSAGGQQERATRKDAALLCSADPLLVSSSSGGDAAAAATGDDVASLLAVDAAGEQPQAPPPSATTTLQTKTTTAAAGGGLQHQQQQQQQRPLRLDILPPPPPSSTSSRRSPLGCGGGGGGETYASPLGEPLLRAMPPDALPSAGTPLGAHHELQLLREQLEQQAQQTQAAVAQVHLLRDQLAAETAARLEAQARTHQLLVHNKELLDHITVLVAHLQEQERHLAAAQASNQQQQHQHHQQQHQQQQQQRLMQQQSLSHQTPHVVTSVPQIPTGGGILCDAQTPPAAPVYLPPELGGPDLDLLARSNGGGGGLIENRNVAARPPSLYDQLFQQQLLQALSGVGAYRPPPPAAYYPPAPPPPSLFVAPPSYRVSQASSYAGSPVLPRAAAPAPTAAGDASPLPERHVTSLTPPRPQPRSPPSGPPPLEATFIKPLPQTVVVACDPGEGADTLMPPRRKNTGGGASLRVCDSGGGRLLNGPPLISRSTSEKVPHRSELMSQVQRTQWARHTTK